MLKGDSPMKSILAAVVLSSMVLVVGCNQQTESKDAEKKDSAAASQTETKTVKTPESTSTTESTTTTTEETTVDTN